MPRYDYRCTACGHVFEARHGYHDAAPPCPACGAGAPQKLLPVVGVIVKGAPNEAASRFTPDAGCPTPDLCAAGGCLGSRFSPS
jgi:putative FmdB family regulatory protein